MRGPTNTIVHDALKRLVSSNPRDFIHAETEKAKMGVFVPHNHRCSAQKPRTVQWSSVIDTDIQVVSFPAQSRILSAQLRSMSMRTELIAPRLARFSTARHCQEVG